MQAATVSGPSSVQLLGVDSIWDGIKAGVTAATGAVKSALTAGCGVANSVPGFLPYANMAQGACQVIAPAVGGGAGNTTAVQQAGGGAVPTTAAGTAAAMQQAQLMAMMAAQAEGARPWYKKPAWLIGIGAGVAVLGTGTYLLTRSGGKKRRR